MESSDADAATTAYQRVQASPRGTPRGSEHGSSADTLAPLPEPDVNAAVAKAAGLFLRGKNKAPMQMTRTAEARVSTHGPTVPAAPVVRSQTAELEEGGDIPDKQSPRPPTSVGASTRALPSCYLGRGYRRNSYFARRLWNLTIVLAVLNAIGVAAFWMSNDIDDGGLYVRNPSESLTFRQSPCRSASESCESCKTLVVYATLVYHMLPVVVMMGLPASGWRVFEPFKRELRIGGDHRKSKIKRSLYLQACELVGVLVVLVNIVIFFYFVYSLFQGNNFNCHTNRVIIYSYCAVFCFFAMFVELTYFARFREHIKMLLGAFKEADHTGDIRARLSGRRDGYRSERSRIIHDIRKDLYRAAEMGNLIELQEKLAIAQTRIGEDFVNVMYKNASIRFGIFSMSKKNPMHIAAYHGNVEIMDALLQVGFSVNGFDKVSRVRFTTGDLFWFFAQFFISKPVESSDETAASIFRTTLATPLHCAVSTGQIEAVQWLIRNGADVNVHAQSSHRSDRLPPLFLADNPEIVSILLEAGANQLEVPQPGHMNTLTVLQLAYLRGNIPVANELEEWGGDVALTPLHSAAGSNDAKAVKTLLKAGADPNCLGEHGYEGMNRRTPLHWASINGALDAVKILLEHDANPNFQDIDGRTPLHWAARANRPEVVTVLLESGADPAIRDSMFMTPILCAAEARSIKSEVIHKLVENGANIQRRASKWRHSAASGNERRESGICTHSGEAWCEHHGNERRRFAPIDCTTSTQLQFEVKNAAGNRDVMISYTHSHSEFALKLRKSLEHANVTTWLDQMDPSGIGGGSVWREEIADGIRNASLVVCILTEDYAKSEWCLKELALAKECGKPILAVSTEHAKITEDLQVSSVHASDCAVRAVHYQGRQREPTQRDVRIPTTLSSIASSDYSWTAFVMRSERQRKHIVQRANLRLSSEMAGTSFDPSAVTELDLSSTTNDFVFLSHGDKHLAFVQRIYDRLTGNGIYCFFDGANSASDFQQRMRVAKEAILKCSCFIVVISNRTADNEVVRDQLAFAEDKGKPILPIMLNDCEITADKLYTLSRSSLFHFTPELGFNASFTTLLQGVKHHVSSSSLQAMPTRVGGRSGRAPALFSAVTRATALNRMRMRMAQAQPSLGETTTSAL
ncbi:hypothetical protein PINS_up018594 [Pythium insidiosum]|nr:hypothetical protein PINS_up018594 [Pythium insidiosum]